ncbi:MAG: hypothetical protein Fur005_48800 [Roseiflexaceae bacterium]
MMPACVTPRRIALSALTLLLLTQFVLPAILLLSPRPARAGWQMYSTITAPIEAQLVAADGTITAVNRDEYIGWYRGELQVGEYFPAAICERNPTAQTILLKQGAREWQYPCRSNG